MMPASQFLNQNAPLTERDWEAIHPDFTRLYFEQGRTLKDVMDFLQDTHCFYASISQYKKQISKWKIRKNISRDEKQELGQLAESFIAAHGTLSRLTNSGKTIPWEKVRRQYGRNKIPLSYLPRVPKARRGTAKRSTGSRPALEMEQLVETSFRGHELSDMQEILHASDPIMLTEYVLLTLKDWFAWCNVKKVSVGSIAGFPAEILSLHRGAATAVRLGDFEQVTEKLRLGSSLLNDAIAKSASIVPAYLLGIWLIFQHRELYPYNIRLSTFMEECCNQKLDIANPLSKLCKLLKQTDVLNAATRSAGQNLTLSSLVPIMTYLLDQIKSFQGSNDPESPDSFSLLPLGGLLDDEFGQVLTKKPDRYRMMEDFYRNVMRVISSTAFACTDPCTGMRLGYYLSIQGRYQEASKMLFDSWASLQGTEDPYDRHALVLNLVYNLYMNCERYQAEQLFAGILGVDLWDDDGFLILRGNTWLVIPTLVDLYLLLSERSEYEKLAALRGCFPALEKVRHSSWSGKDAIYQMIEIEKHIVERQETKPEAWPSLTMMTRSTQSKKIQQISEEHQMNIKPYRGTLSSYGRSGSSHGSKSGGGCGGGGDDTNGK